MPQTAKVCLSAQLDRTNTRKLKKQSLLAPSVIFQLRTGYGTPLNKHVGVSFVYLYYQCNCFSRIHCNQQLEDAAVVLALVLDVVLELVLMAVVLFVQSRKLNVFENYSLDSI